MTASVAELIRRALVDIARQLWKLVDLASQANDPETKDLAGILQEIGVAAESARSRVEGVRSLFARFSRGDKDGDDSDGGLGHRGHVRTQGPRVR